MKKLPLIILLTALSGLHLTACADDDTAKPQAQTDTTAETKPAETNQAATTEAKPAEGEQAAADTKPAEGEQAAAETKPAESEQVADAKPADGGEKKAGGGDEPDCN